MASQRQGHMLYGMPLASIGCLCRQLDVKSCEANAQYEQRKRDEHHRRIFEAVSRKDVHAELISLRLPMRPCG